MIDGGSDIEPASELNRVVWMLWLQGFENAPEIVRLCLRSWKVRNPTWRVIELTDENLSDYVDGESLAALRSLRNIRPQKVANLVRLYLISRHGGVWADATCFCCKPLDDWLPDYIESGFFAFRFRTDAWLWKSMNSGWSTLWKRAGTRIISNWFFAARRGNYLASTVYERHMEFFASNDFSFQGWKRVEKRVRTLGLILNRNARTAQWWTLPIVTRITRSYPYFIFHYHFARIVSEDARCREIWERTPVFNSRGAMRMMRFLVSPITPTQLDDINQTKQPLYKLTWKYRHEDFQPGCVLDHLMRSLPAS